MSDAATHQILTDLVHCVVLSLPLALLVYGWQRREAGPAEPIPFPLAPGVPSDGIDLVVAIGLILAMRAMVAAAPAAAEPAVIDLSTVLTDLGAKCLLLVLLLVYLRGMRGRSLSGWLGLHPVWDGRFVIQAVSWAAAGGGLAYLSNRVVSGFLLEPLGFAADAQDVVRIFTETPSVLLRVSLTVTACLFSPVVEEAIFRGFLYPVVRRFTDGPFAVVFTGMLFGLVHRNLHGAVPLAALGMVLAVAYERSRGLSLPIAIHALFNTASIVFMWIAETTPAP